jgi:hypothetical protein
MIRLGDASSDDPLGLFAPEAPAPPNNPLNPFRASSWGTDTAPTPAAQPPAVDRILNSSARPPAGPGSLATSPNPSAMFPPPTPGAPGNTIFGVIPLPSWLPKWAAYGVLLVAGAFAADYLYRNWGGRRVVRNPKDRPGRKARKGHTSSSARTRGADSFASIVGGESDLVERAADFRKKFHWGIPGRKVRRAKVPKAPKVMTKLGEIVNITYKTKKRGESAQFFVHEFGEEGGRRPTLGMDIENKKLHFVGGDYDVTADGIKD